MGLKSETPYWKQVGILLKNQILNFVFGVFVLCQYWPIERTIKKHWSQHCGRKSVLRNYMPEVKHHAITWSHGIFFWFLHVKKTQHLPLQTRQSEESSANPRDLGMSWMRPGSTQVFVRDDSASAWACAGECVPRDDSCCAGLSMKQRGRKRLGQCFYLYTYFFRSFLIPFW